MPDLSPQRFKATIYQQLARIGKALASPRRLDLLTWRSAGGAAS